MEYTRYITANITPICVQNRNPLQVISLTFHHAEAQTQRPGEPPLLAFSGCMGEEKVSNAAHNVVSQEMCARGAGVVQHPDALTQLHTGAVHAAVRVSSLSFSSLLTTNELLPSVKIDLK